MTSIENEKFIECMSYRESLCNRYISNDNTMVDSEVAHFRMSNVSDFFEVPNNPLFYYVNMNNGTTYTFRQVEFDKFLISGGLI